MKIKPQPITGNDKEQAVLVMRLIGLFWLLAKFIGWKVWIKDRLFPLVPLADFLNWPSFVHYILFVVSVASIAFIIFRPFNKTILIVLFVTELFSCAADQNRWQPWEYQHLFSILICIINFNHPRKIITAIAFIMATTYLYSGIGKFNEGYLVLVWDNIFLKKTFKVPLAVIHENAVHYSGYITALLETIFAAGLFFSKTKKAAAWSMIAMHLLILYALGPLGINYNMVVWPWNVLMMILLYLIFIKDKTHVPDISLLWKGRNKIVLFAWGVLPALNYVGLWDNYLSSRLYSGGLPLMAICINDNADLEELRSYSSKSDNYNLCNGKAVVNLQTWAMKEMNVPPYPELRVYKKIEAGWQTLHPGSTAGFIYYYVSYPGLTIKIETK